MSGRDRRLFPAEAARRLGIDATTLRRYAARGEVESEVTPGGHRRYHEDDLRKFVERCAKDRKADERD